MFKLHKKKILSALIAASIISSFPSFNYSSVYAAETINLEANGKEDTREPIGDRIQKILDNYEKSQAENDATVTEGPSARPVDLPPPSNNVIPPEANEKRMSFDWRNANITQSIYGIAKAMGMGVVINAKVDGVVYANLKNVTCSQALDYLGRAYNFNWMIENGTIFISTNALMKQTEVFNIDYADKKKIVEEFKSLGIESARIFANSENGTVSVTGTPWQLTQARRMLEKVDLPTKQCLVLAQLIEVTNGRDLSHGVAWELPTYTKESGGPWGNWGERLSLSAAIMANKNLSKGKVIARPLVSMYNGETGKVTFGDSVPILSTTTTSSSTTVSVEYKDVGTKLSIVPNINDRLGEVGLNVDIEVSNIVSWQVANGTRAPQIATRTAKTTARLKSGESFVIGGLMSKRELDNLVGIPGLMDLPLLGSLFRYHDKSTSFAEVYVIITPFIVAEGVNPKALLSSIKRQDETANATAGK